MDHASRYAMLVGSGPVEGGLEEHLKFIAARAVFSELASRKRSANMLFIGACSGFLGFMFAFAIGLVKERVEGHTDALGQPFKSGRGYFPSTVSEMVHDPAAPAGKVFFAFCFVGAVMIFFSWYPTMIRNVYIGDDAQCCGVSWVTWRQFIPAPGMMMLSIITTVPAPLATPMDDFCITLHLIGAAMLFVGYFVCEAHCVGWGPFHGRLDPGKLLDHKKSIQKRKFCLTAIGFTYSLFCILQVALCLPLFEPDAYDQWGELPGLDGKHLIDTACWKVKALKVASYSSEVICGLFLILSHLIIWHNCEERHYDLPEALAEFGGSKTPKDSADSDEDSDMEDTESDDYGLQGAALC